MIWCFIKILDIRLSNRDFRIYFMQNRRDFLKTAALAALGSGLVVRQTLAGESLLYNINKLGLGGKNENEILSL